MVAKTKATPVPTISIEQPQLAHELDAWDDCISTLNQALRDIATARLSIEQEEQALDRIEASHVLSIDGGNAESRKARLTLELADDGRYQAHLRALRQARHDLMDADRRVAITKERCRLLRATVTLSLTGRGE